MGPSIHFCNKKFSVVEWGGVNLMSAPGPCLVQGAIGPGAWDRGLALDKKKQYTHINNRLLFKQNRFIVLLRHCYFYPYNKFQLIKIPLFLLNVDVEM